MASYTSGTCLLLLLLAVHVQAYGLSGRKLRSDRPAHDYAQSVSILSSQTAIQRIATNGGSAEHVKDATTLSLKNAQHATKNWHMGYSDGVQGASGNKMARDDNDDFDRK